MQNLSEIGEIWTNLFELMIPLLLPEKAIPYFGQ